MYMTLFRIYSEIASEHYQKYLEAETAYHELAEKVYKNYDLDMMGDLNDALFVKLKEAYISVVFEACTVESFINTLGVSLLGDAFYEEYENKQDRNRRFNTITKIAKLTYQMAGKDIFSGTQVKSDIELLFETRDKLVHSKAAEMDKLLASKASGREVLVSIMGAGNQSIHQVIKRVNGTNRRLVELLDSNNLRFIIDDSKK